MAQISIQTMLKKLKGLINTDDVNEWENKFLKSVVPMGIVQEANSTGTGLTEKQYEVLLSLYRKHFGD
jgi:hypothetical protein